MADDSYSFENEEWRDVLGYEGSYRVSSLGRVYTFLRKPKIRKLKVTKFGYLSLRLQGAGGDKMALVHQLVCAAFHGPKPTQRHVVAHNDGDKFNNKADNLRWCTQSENLADRNRHGTALWGERNGASKLSPKDVLGIRKRLSDGATYKAIAEEYSVGVSTVCRVSLGKTWSEIV